MFKGCLKGLLENRKKIIEITISVIIVFFLVLYACYIYISYVRVMAVDRAPESSINLLDETAIESKNLINQIQLYKNLLVIIKEFHRLC